jgi:oligoendopeptidase F
MKARWLGMDRLNHWDRNAPLPDKPERVFTWKEAEETVLSAYGQFAPEMAATAKQFFDKGWIDAPVRAGTVQKLEETILSKARDLRRAQFNG